MATTQYTGVIYGEYSKYNRLRINYTVSQDDATAISTITMSLYAERTRTYRQYNNYGNSYWNLTGTGNNYIKFDWAEGSSEYYLGNSSTTVQHNAEGLGSVTLSGYWYTGRTGSNSIPESMSISQTITLKTIPRASTVSGGSGNIGAETTISISRKSNSFTHTLRYSFSDLTGTIATGVGTSYPWKIPTSFYAKIPNDPSGKGTIYCDTYNGSTLIGTKSTTFTATASESSSRPTVTGTVIDINETTKALTGDANKLILGKSTAKITVTPSVKNSATLKTVTIDGVATTNNTRTIANVTKKSFPIVVTDSREYTNTPYSATATGDVVNYIPLTLNASFFRPQPTTGEIQLTYSGNYFNGNFGAKQNSVGIEWHYRVKGSDTWIKGGTITPTINGNTIEKKTISLGTTYDYQTAYEFHLYAQDFLTSYSTTSVVSVGLPVFNWGKDYLNVNGDIRRHGMSTHYLYAQATTPTNGTSIDAVNGGGELQRTKICSIYDASNNWYNLINIRHQNGEGDGVWYGMQIRRHMINLSAPIQTRAESNGVWTGWEQIPRYQVLYDNASGTTGTVTLIDTSTNYAYLEIFYSLHTSSEGYIYSSTKVPVVSGRTQISINRALSGNGMQIVANLIDINDTSITRAYDAYYTFTNGVLSSSGPMGLHITKVIGYR